MQFYLVEVEPPNWWLSIKQSCEGDPGVVWAQSGRVTVGFVGVRVLAWAEPD
jgi:hypothetical protein